MIASRVEQELPQGLRTVDEALHRTRFRILPFLGPAFIACVAYIDPGNFATNIAAGSKFGYLLVWVIVAANLMAMLIQVLSAKLGIATGRNLPEVARDELPRRVTWGLWVQAELIAMATDLAEFLGATVMPHVIYLHSALTQDRLIPETDDDAKTLLRYTRVDVIIAMSIAGLINVAMLVVAAATFYKTGLVGVDSLERAHKTLEPILGSASSALFALALIASGLSSSAVGTLSGQVVMQGFIRRQVPVFFRRIVTMVPAFIVIGIGVDPSRTLVISQVVLSFGIPFALVPLVWFTSRRHIMGPLVNRRLTTVAATVIAAIIVSLNVVLLVLTFGG